MYGIFTALYFLYIYVQCTCSICAYIQVMHMSQVTRSVDGTMTSSTAAGIDVDKSKR